MYLIFSLELTEDVIKSNKKEHGWYLMDMTYGKTYEVFIGDRNSYFLIDDDECSIQLPREFISSKEEWRDKRINKIVNEKI